VSQDTKVMNFYAWDIEWDVLKIPRAKAKHLIGKLVAILHHTYTSDLSRFLPDAQCLMWIGGLGIVDKWDLPRMSIACRRRNPMPLAENRVSGRCGAVMEGNDLKWTCTDSAQYDIQKFSKLTRSVYWFAWNLASIGFKFSPNVTKHMKTCDGAEYSKRPLRLKRPCTHRERLQ